MLTLSRFTVALALASSIIGVTIPAIPSRRSGELWEGLEHEEIDLGGLAPPRRSGELWLGAEHDAVGLASSRRSGELWLEAERGGLGSSRRSGDLWHGSEHEEAFPSTDD